MLLDPGPRAEALRSLRYRDLKDPAVLADTLAACRDTRPVPGAAPRADVDPFASFFGEPGAPSPDTTVGDVAAERLRQTGLPADTTSAQVLADALRAEGPAGTLPKLAVTALGETRWDDLGAALRAVVPALIPHDEPLFETIARLPEEGWAVLADLSAAPFAPRLWQELLNHAPAHPLAVQAVTDAVLEDRLVPDETQAASILAVLASWGEADATRSISAHVRGRLPWTDAWAALEDADAATRLKTWLRSGAAGPPGLAARLAEILRHRGPTEVFPLAEWLAWAGSGHGVVEVWGADAADVRVVLQRWVDDVAVDPDRGWRAAAALAPGGLSEAARAALQRHLDSLPWEASILDPLAAVSPPLDWLSEALADGLVANAEQVAVGVGALKRLGAAACRPALVRALELARAAPRITTPAGPSTVRIERDGVDVDGLRPLADLVADDALTALLEDLAPVVRGV